MPIDLSGLYFFMPIISFFFVFIVIYAVLWKTKILGDSAWVYILISFILSIIFMSFSSMELYVRTILPWFVILVVIVFLVLVIGGLSTKSLDKIMTSRFAWFFIIVLLIIFIIAAIQVFNPVLHPGAIITSGGPGSTGLGSQISDFFSSSKYAGSLILFVIAAIVTWVLIKFK